MESTLTHQLAEIRSRVVHACERVKRDPKSVSVLLASKTIDPLRIRNAFNAGATLFGENKVQEFLEKYPSLTDLPIDWHFIGQLQSNKVKSILPLVTLIHSLDRLSLAEEIQKQAEKQSIHVNVLIEVNSSGEINKGGIAPKDCAQFAQDLKRFDRIQVKGLMSVAIDGTPKQTRDCFRLTKLLLDEIRPFIAGDTLSMGMSNDFEVAIEEGSTLIRLGSSVFGKRS